MSYNGLNIEVNEQLVTEAKVKVEMPGQPPLELPAPFGVFSLGGEHATGILLATPIDLLNMIQMLIKNVLEFESVTAVWELYDLLVHEEETIKDRLEELATKAAVDFINKEMK